MKFLSWLLALPVIVVVASFAVSNRQAVDLALWPLPFQAAAPLYLPVLAAFLLGLLAAALPLGLGMMRWRLRARRARRRAETLEREAAARHEQEASSAATESSGGSARLIARDSGPVDAA